MNAQTGAQKPENLKHEDVGSVAYKLELPRELSRVHNTFHVSKMKKCYADEPLAVPLDGLHFDDKLHFVEEPVEIMDGEVKRLKRSRIPLVKVRWNSKRGPEFTWEREDQFRKKYPHLFSKTAPSSTLAALKSVKPKVKANVVEEPSVPVSAASSKVSAATTTKTATIPTPRKGIVITELELEKPLKKKDQISFDDQKAIRLQAEFDEEERLEREKDEANVALIEECDDIQAQLEQEVTKKQKVDDVQETAKVDDDQEAAKIKELMEIVPDEEEVAIDVIPLATKPPTIVDWKIHKEGKKNYYQIIRADGSSKMYLVFSHMLKSFVREDFETLWKLVKAKHGSTRPEEGYET
ncbi:hypothetical protein Tco_0911298 [Tanacetum coccineum]|uniref:Tf2-1-like SH3-like domain-containing protein n=1 Tax=Tanacetum coccineum TaxID=301880 RepID=A0ABQ5CXJ5_9ASTR